jgi:hypothetical protein
LALYVGWTDSFSFNKDLQPASVRTSARATAPRNTVVKPWFARVPRDIRRNRRPLVAPWVAIVPPNGGKRDQVAFRFLDALLHPDTQHDLLRQGFPTSSDVLVMREIERIRLSRRDNHEPHNYATFLLTLHDALTTGHLVPNLPDTEGYIATIRDVLRGFTAAAMTEPIPTDTIHAQLRPVRELLLNLTGQTPLSLVGIHGTS